MSCAPWWASGARHRAGLRGSDRPRYAAPRSDDGGAGRQVAGEAAGLRAGGRKSTLNRLELSSAQPGPFTRSAIGRRRSRRCSCSSSKAHRAPPAQIVLDLDATDDPLHGHQEGRFFHGYYDGYAICRCTSCGRHLLAAKLRRANIDASAGAVEEVARIVSKVRRRWPHVRILLRADSGFAREALMAWCEATGSTTCSAWRAIPGWWRRLRRSRRRPGPRPRRRVGRPGATRTSSGHPRQLVVPAPGGGQGGVDRRQGQSPLRGTSLRPQEARSRRLYETLYCARGEMENRIKECQLRPVRRPNLGPHHARQPTAPLVRLHGYVLLCALRLGLAHTRFAKATLRQHAHAGR